VRAVRTSLVLCGLVGLAGCYVDEDPGFDTLLVSIDGTPPVLLDEEWDTLTTIPTFMEGGSRQELQVQGVTDTMASHAKLLTGYGDDVTGVTSAFHWQPIPAGLSIPERLRKRFGPNLAIDWVVNKPYMLAFDTDDEPFWFAGKACDVAIDREMIADITPDMIAALEDDEDKPFFAFFHWGGVDKAGHEYGERSPEQRQALHDVDDQLGVIKDELIQLGRWDRTRVYLTTDHGFLPGGDRHYSQSSEVFLLTNNPDIGTGTWSHQLTWRILRDYGVEDDDVPAPVEPL
jgi:hypothetical protein